MIGHRNCQPVLLTLLFSIALIHVPSPALGQPATGQPATEQPASGQPASGQPASGQLASGQLASDQPASEHSGLNLVAGFDLSRVEDSFLNMQQDDGAELAKLIYKLQKINEETLSSRATKTLSDSSIGDLLRSDGVIESTQTFEIPQSLHELLGFESLSAILVSVESVPSEASAGEPTNAETQDHTTGQRVQVFCAPLPREAVAGDRVSFVGMTLTSQSPWAIAAPSMRWFPSQASSSSWQWLANQDFDISLLPELASRDRKDLVPQDSDAFYGLLAITSKKAGQGFPKPTAVAPIELLQRSRENVGEYVSMELESVQITRVAVESPARRNEIGSDHYYQIDAFGDLGNVVIQIETGGTDVSGKTAVFENRYPVSLVTTELPEFLRREMEKRDGSGAIISDVAMRIRVDGFFFRLWSYASDYMKQFGDAQQFGPLVVVAQIENLEPTTADPVGVRLIGWLAAAAIALGIVAIWVWSRFTAAEDREVRNKRREQSSKTIDIPDS
ncbi:hypothetical protein Pla22_01010 [Rubripirellula amarantea]|uniref:Uncharacterized protein n=1 Tax=Rubripirellula amarantea TaxID=2527999 RepID=A0A5C5WPH8_9BACT|nr:hypothetical protein [Rubripirellula amarantea]TWT52477.1 hypothetical protein Pla22_01010 [Rubripirellula amarantea]